MITVLFYLAWIIAIVLVAVGIHAILAPHPLARRYGVTAHTPDAAAFVRATGIRDIALGVVLGATAYVRFLPLLMVLAVAGIAVSIADFLIVLRHHETKKHHAAHAIHASGIVAFVLILAMALFAIGR
ncbi:MAG TPA: DUF4267 domain-containing protein [Candidatus Cybelea sp.]